MANVSKYMKKSQPSYIASGNVKWRSFFRKSLVIPQKIKQNYDLHHNSTLKEMQTYIHTKFMYNYL